MTDSANLEQLIGGRCDPLEPVEVADDGHNVPVKPPEGALEPSNLGESSSDKSNAPDRAALVLAREIYEAAFAQREFLTPFRLATLVYNALDPHGETSLLNKARVLIQLERVALTICQDGNRKVRIEAEDDWRRSIPVRGRCAGAEE